MIPIYEKVPTRADTSFHTVEVRAPFFPSPLHYHEELEIMYVSRSFGQRIVSNSIKSFSEGDLVLVGSNVPHVWKNDDSFYERAEDESARAYVIQFRRDFAGNAFLTLPETASIRAMMDKAAQGLYFDSTHCQILLPILHEVFSLNGMSKMVQFIHLLHQMSQLNPVPLSHRVHEGTLRRTDCEKINKIYDYVFSNFTRHISLNEMAEIVHMSPPALCRFIRRHTYKSFIEIVNEVKINESCRLLAKPDVSAAEACFASGFTNYSYYFSQFKRHMLISPSEYKRQCSPENPTRTYN